MRYTQPASAAPDSATWCAATHSARGCTAGLTACARARAHS